MDEAAQVLFVVLRMLLAAALFAATLGAGWLVFSACERGKRDQIEDDAD